MADVDTNACAEPPETPAPVFAVRAFKHAIFGTPQTQVKPPRRHSNNDTVRPRHNARPGAARTKSTNDTQAIGRPELAIEEEPAPSPTKGILLTPGTAAARRKTVSFGDHVVDNEGKRPVKSGLPDDCPGKFPSPWSKTSDDVDSSDEPKEKQKGRSKLTEALEQARIESAKRKSGKDKPSKVNDDVDLTMDFSEPRSESGKYWKQEYDIYRERTTREVKKLVEKNKDAKRYAREKDSRCTELKDELRQERKKVERLERRTAELEFQLKEYHDELQGRKADVNGAVTSIVHLVPDAPKSTTVEARDKTQHDDQLAANNAFKPRRREQAPPLSDLATKSDTRFNESSQRIKDEDVSSKPRARPRHIHTRSQDNVWTHSLETFNAGSTNAPTVPSSPGRAVTSGTNATPLKSLSVNTLSQDTRSVALSMGMQPPSPEREKRRDSPLRSPELPIPSPELPAKATRRTFFEPAKVENDHDGLSAVPESSPFQPDVVSERPNVLTGAPVPVRPALRAPTKPPDAKENISPPLRPQKARNEESAKPTAAWNALSAPALEKRIVSKDGRELDAERLEKAKARLASKGRQVS